MDNEVVCIIPQSLFDHLAEKEGQVEDGFKIHAVDRVAGTLRIGAQLMKVVKLVPMEVGTFDRLQIIESTAQEFALRNREKKSIDISSTIPRGAHWRTDHQAYSRLRAINDDRCADSRAVLDLWLTAKADRERKDALLLQCLRHNMPNSMKDNIKEELKC